MNLLKRIQVFFFVKPPRWVRRISSGMIWRIPTDEKVLFLTFDDGPGPELTPWILAELVKFGAKATFFCVGENVTKYPESYKLILDGGHDTGNHTFHHLNGYKTGIGNYIRDVYKARKVIDSRLFRPPYGRIRPMAARILMPRFRIILWDVLSMDYDAQLDPKMVLYNVAREARPGSILVFHDNEKASENLRFVLPLILDHFSRQGYKFLPLKQYLS
jgi:peptidoglycan/xylan/chitin deacetylase (PgdA/CDA1 family)